MIDIREIAMRHRTLNGLEWAYNWSAIQREVDAAFALARAAAKAERARLIIFVSIGSIVPIRAFVSGPPSNPAQTRSANET